MGRTREYGCEQLRLAAFKGLPANDPFRVISVFATTGEWLTSRHRFLDGKAPVVPWWYEMNRELEPAVNITFWFQARAALAYATFPSSEAKLQLRNTAQNGVQE